MKCPDCDNTGKVHGIACGGKGGCRVMALDCFRCGGSGQVPEQMKEWIKIGKKMRAQRMEPWMSQRDKAKQLGVSPSDYSRAEQGYINPDIVLTVVKKQ
jgi:DNA-binding XRE family transcriptional regulator